MKQISTDLVERLLKGQLFTLIGQTAFLSINKSVFRKCAKVVEGHPLLNDRSARIVRYGIAVFDYKCLKVSGTWTHVSCLVSATVIKMSNPGVKKSWWYGMETSNHNLLRKSLHWCWSVFHWEPLSWLWFWCALQCMYVNRSTVIASAFVFPNMQSSIAT